jgi:hypothetical protein
MFAAKELYAELVLLSYSQRVGGLLVRKSLGGCGHTLDEDQLQISELPLSKVRIQHAILSLAAFRGLDSETQNTIVYLSTSVYRRNIKKTEHNCVRLNVLHVDSKFQM